MTAHPSDCSNAFQGVARIRRHAARPERPVRTPGNLRMIEGGTIAMPSKGSKAGKKYAVAVLFVAMLWLSAASASAQSATSATIRGKVTDDTNAALPGVTVTISSPALIETQQIKATDA